MAQIEKLRATPVRIGLFSIPHFLFSIMIVIARSQNSKPNILMLVVDDLGWTDISHHGAEYSTPNIDSLFTNGVELTAYYTQSTCSPTRSSIMTGKYAWKTGLQFVGTIAPGTTEHIPFEFPTMAEVLSSVGYSTHAIGKWHLGYASFNMTPTGRGFDTHYGYYQGEETYTTHHFWYDNPLFEGYDFWQNDNVYFDAIGNYSTSLYLQYMDTLLSKQKSNVNPFFIYMAFQTIHIPVLDFDGTPENPPILYDECAKIESIGRQTFCNKMKYLDDQIGQMIGLLRANSLYDDTVIALTTDNGGLPYFNTSQTEVTRGISWGCNYPLRGGKTTDFEGGIRGVGVISGNLVRERGLNGTTFNGLSHAKDWMATFVEGIAESQLPKDKDFDSVNIWNALGSSSSNGDNWNQSTLFVDIQSEQGLFTVINETSGHVWKFMNLSNAKYWDWYHCDGTIDDSNLKFENLYLFDLKSDPNEKHNLYSQNMDIALELSQMIEEELENDYYYPEQDRQIYAAAYPQNHNGVWAPWL